MEFDRDDLNEELRGEGVEFTGGSRTNLDEDDSDDSSDSSDDVSGEGEADIEEDSTEEEDVDSLDLPYDDSDATKI